MTAIKINVSNTGKNITLTVRDETLMSSIRENGLRGKLSYNHKSRQFTLRPHAEGWKFCDKGNGVLYLSVQSRVFPKWPTHGTIEVELFNDFADWVAKLPEKESLPLATPRASSSHKAKEVLAPVAPQYININLPATPPSNGNVILEVKGKTWCFQVPDDELLELAVGLAAKGYATK